MNAKAAAAELAAFLPAKVKALLKGWHNPPTYPTFLQVEPTRRCNLRCVMCARTHFGGDPKPDMTVEMFRSIVEQFPPGLETINIQGMGEPLLHEGLIDMIRFARGRGIRTWFFSNLQYFNEDLAEALVEADHNEITVSIDSTDPAHYADIRRGGTLERVLENLETLKEAKARAGRSHPEVSVHAILMKHLLANVPEMVSTLRTLGVARLHFTDLNPYEGHDAELADGRMLHEQAMASTMSDREIWEALKQIAVLGDDRMAVTVPGDCKGVHLARPERIGVVTCAELWGMPFITCDGYMTPCCYGSHPSIFNMGNFHERTFEEIWFGEPYRKLRRQHLMNRHPEYCRKCPQLFLTFATPSRLVRHGEIRHRCTQGWLGAARGGTTVDGSSAS